MDPVIRPDSSVATKATARATSSGSTRRPNGCAAVALPGPIASYRTDLQPRLNEFEQYADHRNFMVHAISSRRAGLRFGVTAFQKVGRDTQPIRRFRKRVAGAIKTHRYVLWAARGLVGYDSGSTALTVGVKHEGSASASWRNGGASRLGFRVDHQRLFGVRESELPLVGAR